MPRGIFFWGFVTVLGLVHSAQAWGSLGMCRSQSYSAKLNIAFVFLPPVLGYLRPGHKTVANVALHFLQPEVLASIQTILVADERKTLPNPSIVDVATWADDWSRKRDGAFSKTFHHIDALDDPPFECNVVLERDCSGSGCIVTAM